MNLIGFFTLLYRECHRFLRLPNQTLIPPVITASLYILIFGYSLGSRISDIEGVSYLTFLIPGLVMMSVISSAYGNTSSSVYIARFQGNIAELLVSSMSNFEIVLAIILGGVARGICVGICVAATSMLFAAVTIVHFGITALFVIGVAFIFSAAGFVTALWAEDFDRLSVFQNYILTPLTYLGGVFFSVQMLPEFWQKIAMVNPMLYCINGLRFGYIGISDVDLGVAAVLITVLSVVMFLWCYLLFRKGYKIKT